MGISCVQSVAHRRWIPPKEGTFKVNFDGAVFKDSSCSGMGVIVRDHKGECAAALSQKVNQCVSTEFIKILAARRAVQFAMESGFWHIHLEGDEMKVVQALKAKSMSDKCGVVEEIQSLLSGVSCEDISWTSRNCNGAARSLAEFAKQVDDYRVWLEDVPEFVDLDVVDDIQ